MSECPLFPAVVDLLMARCSPQPASGRRRRRRRRRSRATRLWLRCGGPRPPTRASRATRTPHASLAPVTTATRSRCGRRRRALATARRTTTWRCVTSSAGPSPSTCRRYAVTPSRRHAVTPSCRHDWRFSRANIIILCLTIKFCSFLIPCHPPVRTSVVLVFVVW